MKSRNLANVKKRLEDAAVKSRNLANVKKRLEDPVVKSRNSENAMRRLLDPMAKRRHLDMAKKRLEDPVNKSKNLDNVKMRYRMREKYYDGVLSRARTRGRVIADNPSLKKKKSDAELKRRRIDVDRRYKYLSRRRLLYDRKLKGVSRTYLVDEAFACVAEKWFKLINDSCLQFVCTSCNQVNYRDQVVLLNSDLKDRVSEIADLDMRFIVSVEGKVWVCRTCKNYIMRGRIPLLSEANGFQYPCVAEKLANLSRLEERLLSARCPFLSVCERPNGGQLSCKGSVINVPNSVAKTYRVIPRDCNETFLMAVDFKRRMSDRHPYMSSDVRPAVILECAEYLPTQPLYKQEGIRFNENWQCELPPNLDFLAGNREVVSDDRVENSSESEDEVEPSRRTDLGNFDTMLSREPVMLTADKKMCFAPCEGNKPLPMFKDEFCEELAYVSVWGGYARLPTKNRVTYGQLCKADFRSADTRFQEHPELLFFRLNNLQQRQIFGKATVAVRKAVCGRFYG